MLGVLSASIQRPGLLLEIAPTKKTTRLLAALEPGVHVRLDLGADNRRVDVLGSLTQLPHRDSSVDLLVCYHVLEHIPDDRAAIAEMARVLAPDGLALVQVPWRPGVVTDEDPEASEEERVRRFGQADHVRFYGSDFEERLAEHGLSVDHVTPRSLVGANLASWMRMIPDETVWILRRAERPSIAPHLAVSDVPPTSLTRTFDVMLREMVRLRRKLVETRAEVRRLEAELGRTTRTRRGAAVSVLGSRLSALRARLDRHDG